MKYKILFAGTPYELEQEVNKHLELGWQLVGGVSVARFIFAQAVISGKGE